ALISSQGTSVNAVYIGGSAGTVTNWGTIETTGTASGAGVSFAPSAAGTVTNFGIISATGSGNGVHFAAGTLTNSGTILTTGTGAGVLFTGNATIANTGTIIGRPGISL